MRGADAVPLSPATERRSKARLEVRSGVGGRRPRIRCRLPWIRRRCPSCGGGMTSGDGAQDPAVARDVAAAAAAATVAAYPAAAPRWVRRAQMSSFVLLIEADTDPPPKILDEQKR